MKFKRETTSCLWPGCPNKTRRTMRDQDPVKCIDGKMHGTTVILCEFHLKKVMEELQRNSLTENQLH